MQSISISILLVCLPAIFATNVNFQNRCGGSVNVVRTANGEQSVTECDLGPGASCSRSYGGNAMNFKNGVGGLTLAEFSFNNWGGLDFYDLSVIVGYDTAMQISSSTGGPTVTCTSPDCGDAYQYPSDDSKNHGTGTGGTFNVVFCP